MSTIRNKEDPLAARSRGYRHIMQLADKPVRSDFPRPHRKALMETVFNKTIHCRQIEARKVALAANALSLTESLPIQASGDIILGTDLFSRKHHTNAVAAAIDHPSLPNSRIQSVRPPIKVPKNYLSRLKNLEPIGQALSRQHHTEVAKCMPKETMCNLKFEDVVLDSIKKNRKSMPPRKLNNGTRELMKANTAKNSKLYPSEEPDIQTTLTYSNVNTKKQLEIDSHSLFTSPSQTCIAKQTPAIDRDEELQKTSTKLAQHRQSIHTSQKNVLCRSDHLISNSPATTLDNTFDTFGSEKRRESLISSQQDALLFLGSKGAGLRKNSLIKNPNASFSQRKQSILIGHPSTIEAANQVTATNLAYMLMVWNRAEDANLKSIINNQAKPDPTSHPYSSVSQSHTPTAFNAGKSTTEKIQSAEQEQAIIKKMLELTVAKDDPHMSDLNLIGQMDSTITLPPEADPLFGLQHDTSNMSHDQTFDTPLILEESRDELALQDSLFSKKVTSANFDKDQTLPTVFLRTSKREFLTATTIPTKNQLDFIQQNLGISLNANSECNVFAKNPSYVDFYDQHASFNDPNPSQSFNHESSFTEYPLQSQVNKQKVKGVISHSTFRFLKRLSKENQFAQEHIEDAVHDNDETILRQTLTGNSTAEKYNDDPFTIDSQSKYELEASQASIDLNAKVKKSVLLTSRKHIPASRHHVSKQTWTNLVNRIVNSDDNEPIPLLDASLFELENVSNVYSVKSMLPEYEIDDLSTEADSVAGDRLFPHDFEEASHKTAMFPSNHHTRLMHPPLINELGVATINKKTTSEEFITRLKEIFGGDIIIPPKAKTPLSWSSIFMPIKLRNSKDKSLVYQPDTAVCSSASRFCLKRFVSLVKVHTHHHLPERKSSVDPIEEFRAMHPPINTLIDFLESPLTALEQAPLAGTLEHTALIKVLTLALREEDDMTVQFEACRLLIAMQGQANLTRWDHAIYKTVLENMLQKGTEQERDMAALVSIESGITHPAAMNQIRGGLGHLDPDRRNMARNVFSVMDMKHLDMVIGFLLKDSEHTSWRVRLDVIYLLEIWIRRLLPEHPPSAPERDPDALETDDDALVKALFHTLGTTTNDKEKGNDLNPVDLVQVGDDKNAYSNLFLPSTTSLTPLSAEPVTNQSKQLDTVNPLEKQLQFKKDANIASLSKNDPKLNVSAALDSCGSNVEQQTNLASSPTSMPTKQLSLEAMKYNSNIVKKCVDVLLNIMWTDWNKEVRDAASHTLGALGQGRPIFDWVVGLLGSKDPVKRVDALRSLSYLGVMTKSSLEALLACFKDPYASVRIEVCKFACILASDDRAIVSNLLDLLNDHDYRVRAYAVKALGYSGCKEPKNRETLNWALHHDPHSAVRAEAIQAVFRLDLISRDQTIKEGLFTLFETDRSDKVKQEAKRVLVASGLIFSSMLETERESDSRKEKYSGNEKESGMLGMALGGHASVGVSSAISSNDSNNLNTTTTHLAVPYPHILNDASPDEIDIFLRDSLVGEKELSIAIGQVKKTVTRESIIAEVQYVIQNSQDTIMVGLDLPLNDEFTPQVKQIHQLKKQKL
ncbi:hypothetical protein BATDEDRAFT_34391 [Batrachochytrium dendrobatidis JAM81]|uniref:Uncharacterized protein n=1 Tax=Batrachochytrium dendrobatidis (strain JAM81 / FGSC 10211) TaxID=684364 RepID=F4NVV6_BATDJ|nr:uncharacterized protein BATDEDRAFT_34391 [Batrachochytrium dendrobatidis JAM81]EGF82719.1 hypothetical protein BATDEDRAFT_34391 [Batrachochytrium dendrobatidis JAM81]|eukprot:XP_006676785.1 hypothetical protein BATDEDRAFT_34391 [Batrachochytrium dendrobatidis JAM81]